MPDEQSSNGQSSPRAKLIEWILAAVSAAVVLALLGFLVMEAVTKTGSQPDIGLTLVEVRELNGRFFADVDVENSGHAAAADLVISAIAGPPGQALAAHAILDYAPPESTASITLGFARPVSAGSIELTVSGYREP